MYKSGSMSIERRIEREQEHEGKREGERKVGDMRRGRETQFEKKRGCKIAYG